MRKGLWFAVLSVALLGMLVVPAAMAEDGGDTPAQSALAQAQATLDSIFGDDGSLAWLVQGNPPAGMTVIDAPYPAATEGDLGATDYVTNADSGAPYGVSLDGVASTFTSEGYVRVTVDGDDTGKGMQGALAAGSGQVIQKGGIYVSVEDAPDVGYAAGIDVSSDGTAETSSVSVDNQGDILAQVSSSEEAYGYGILVSNTGTGRVTNSGNVFARSIVTGSSRGGSAVGVQVGLTLLPDVTTASVVNDGGTIYADVEESEGFFGMIDAYGVKALGAAATVTNSGLVVSHASLEDSNTSWANVIGVSAAAQGDAPVTSVTNEEDGVIAAFLETGITGPFNGGGTSWLNVAGLSASASADDDTTARNATVTITNAGTVAAEADIASYDLYSAFGGFSVAGVQGTVTVDGDAGGTATLTLENSGTIGATVAYDDGMDSLALVSGAYLEANSIEGTSRVTAYNSGSVSASMEADGSDLYWLQVGGVALLGQQVVYGGLDEASGLVGASGSVSSDVTLTDVTVYDGGSDPYLLSAGIDIWAADSGVVDSATVMIGEEGSVSASLSLRDVEWEDADEDTMTRAVGINIEAGDGGAGSTASNRGVVVENAGQVSGTLSLVNTEDNGSAFTAAGIIAEIDDSEGMDVSVANTGSVTSGVTASVEVESDEVAGVTAPVSEGAYESGGIVIDGDVALATIANSGSIQDAVSVNGIRGSFDFDGDGTEDADLVEATVGGAEASGIVVETPAMDIANSGTMSAGVALGHAVLDDLDEDGELELSSVGMELTGGTSVDVANTGAVTAAMNLSNVDWELSGEAAALGLMIDVEGDGTTTTTGSTVTVSNGSDETAGHVTASMTLSNAGGEAADYAVAGIHTTVMDDEGTDVTISNASGSSVTASLNAMVTEEGASSAGRYRAAAIGVVEDEDGVADDVTITNGGSLAASVSVSGLETADEAVTAAAVRGASACGVMAEGQTIAFDSSGSISAAVTLDNVVYDDFDLDGEPAAVAVGVRLEGRTSVTAAFDGSVSASVEVSDAAEASTASADEYEGAAAVGAILYVGDAVGATLYVGDEDGGVATLSVGDGDGEAATLSVTNAGGLSGNLVLEDATGDTYGVHRAMGLDARLPDGDGGTLTLDNSGTIAGSLTASGDTSGWFNALGVALAASWSTGTDLAVRDNGHIVSTVDLDGVLMNGGSSVGLSIAAFDTVSIDSTGWITASTTLSDVTGGSVTRWGPEFTTAGISVNGGGSAVLDLGGVVSATTTIDGLDWDGGWGSSNTLGVYATATNGVGGVCSVSVENSGTINAAGTFLDTEGGSHSILGVGEAVSYQDGNIVELLNRGSITASATVGGASLGDYEVYGAYLTGPEVTAINWGNVTVSAQLDSGASLDEYGIYVYAPDGLTFENFGTITVTGNVEGCAICLDNVAAGGTFNSPGAVYTGAQVRALSLENGSQITLQAADGGAGAFGWAFAGDPDEIVRPVYVGAGSMLDLNDGILYAYLTPTTSYDGPYWLFDVDGDGSLVGSFSSLQLVASNPDFTAQMLGTGEETRVQFGYQPHRSIGPLSVHAGMTAVRQVMDNMFNYQAMEFGWNRQIARAAGPVQVASIRPYVGSLSPAAMEQKDGRSTFYARPIFGGNIDASDLGYDANLWGFEVGYRYRVTDKFTLGVFYGYGESDIDMTEAGYQSDGETQTYDAWGAFGRMDWGRFYGMLAVSAFDVDHEYRGVTGTNLDILEEDDYDSDALAARLEVGWAFDMGKWSLVPNASVSWMNWDVDAHHTTAADPTWNRYFDEYDEDFSEASLGIDVTRVWAGEESTVTFFAGLKAEQSLSGNETSMAQWIPGMGTPRVTLEEDVADFSVLGNLGVMAQKKNLRLTLGVAERYNSDYTSWTGYAQVGYRF